MKILTNAFVIFASKIQESTYGWVVDSLKIGKKKHRTDKNYSYVNGCMHAMFSGYRHDFRFKVTDIGDGKYRVRVADIETERSSVVIGKWEPTGNSKNWITIIEAIVESLFSPREERKEFLDNVLRGIHA